MLFRFAIFLLLLSCFNSLITEWGFPEKDNVIVLSEENFEIVIDKFQYIVVFFLARNSPECGRHWQYYTPAADRLKKQERHIPLAMVDISKYPSIGLKYSISAVPYIVMFIDKIPFVEYISQPDLLTLTSWVNHRAKPILTSFSSFEDANHFIATKDVSIIYYGSDNTEKFLAFKDAAKISNQEPAFGYSFENEIRLMSALEPDSIILYTKNSWKKHEYHGNANSIEIIRWTRKLMFQKDRIVNITDHTALALKSSYLDIMVLNAKSAKYDSYKYFEEYVQKNKQDDIIYCFLNSYQYMKVADLFYSADKEQNTNIKLIKPDGSYYYFKEPKTYEDFETFYANITENKIKRKLRKTIPLISPESKVKKLSRKTYDDFIMNPEKDTLISYTTSWCDAICNNIIDIFEQLAKSVKTNDISFGEIDVTSNQGIPHKIESLPDLWLYPKDNKMNPVQYKGPIDILKIISFINTYSSQKIEENTVHLKREL